MKSIVALTFGLAAVLTFAAHSPRGLLNVMQFVALAFFAVLIVKVAARDSVLSDDTAQNRVRLPFLGVILGIIAWLSMLAAGFISDDFGHLAAASHGSYLTQLWSLLRYGQAGVFLRPLGFVSIFLDYTLWGTSPVGYHVTNLILHLASAIALYMIVRQLGGARDLSCVTAGIFTAMPSQVEAVAWMSARFDMLATALTLWAVVFYLHFKQTRNRTTYAAVLLLYLFAMLSKESGFVLPLLLVAAEMFVFERLEIRALGGLIGLGIVTFAYRWFVLSGVGGYSTSGMPSTLAFGLKTLEGLFIRGPSQLILGLNWEQPPSFLVIGIASLTGATLLMLAITSRLVPQNRSLIKLGLAWIILPIIPAHFLLMIGPGLTNSRVLYMASAGAALILGQLIYRLPRALQRQAAVLSLSLLFSIGVVHNIGAWRWTARLSEQVLADAQRLSPSPPPQTEFVFSGLPDTIRGVFFFHACLSDGLRLKYNREDISARRDSEFSADGLTSGAQIRFSWNGERLQPAP